MSRRMVKELILLTRVGLAAHASWAWVRLVWDGDLYGLQTAVTGRPRLLSVREQIRMTQVGHQVSRYHWWQCSNGAQPTLDKGGAHRIRGYQCWYRRPEHVFILIRPITFISISFTI